MSIWCTNRQHPSCSRFLLVLTFLLVAWFEGQARGEQIGSIAAVAATSTSIPFSSDSPPTLQGLSHAEHSFSGADLIDRPREMTRLEDSSQSSVPSPQSPSVVLGDGQNENLLFVVFSDVDGTLVHYDQTKPTSAPSSDDLLYLPPSMTGLQGIISRRTLSLCRSIRKETHRTKLVLVSGMRTQTLLKRLPYLPKADAYCSEAGGRIFYPSTTLTDNGGRMFRPIAFGKGNVADSDEDLLAFCVTEDLEWRKRMEQPSAAGPEGFVGNEVSDPWEESISTLPLSERTGQLWQFARELESQGIVLDTKGYSTCFRVNRTQQRNPELFELLINRKMNHPPTLAYSMNLGSFDFYPVDSGKKNCCQYLLEKFAREDGQHTPPPELKRQAICLCDDDNDLEMALACRHAYIPGISSSSMDELIRQHPNHFTVTEQTNGKDDTIFASTRATELALSLVLEHLASSTQPRFYEKSIE